MIANLWPEFMRTTMPGRNYAVWIWFADRATQEDCAALQKALESAAQRLLKRQQEQDR